MKTDELLAAWLKSHAASLPPGRAVLRVSRARPRFQTRNYFARFKVETADLDGTGQNPTNLLCLVLEISEQDQTAKVAPDACESVADL